MGLERKKRLDSEMVVSHSVYGRGKILMIEGSFAIVSFFPYSQKVKLKELELAK